jgi:hypothetical protein
MLAVSSSDKSVTFYEITRRSIPQDSKIQRSSVDFGRAKTDCIPFRIKENLLESCRRNAAFYDLSMCNQGHTTRLLELGNCISSTSCSHDKVLWNLLVAFPEQQM